jgi:hypothetical protein
VAVYFQVEDPAELRPLLTAVAKAVGRENCADLQRGVTSAPTAEIALALVAAGDRRETMLQAYDLWFDARIEAGLPPKLPRVADVRWPAGS